MIHKGMRSDNGVPDHVSLIILPKEVPRRICDDSWFKGDGGGGGGGGVVEEGWLALC